MTKKHHQFDLGTLDVKVGEHFEITGRFPSMTDRRKVAFPQEAFRVVGEREGSAPKDMEDHSQFGAFSPAGSMTPTAYTLEALKEGTYDVEYLYFAAPQTVHNADKYTVRVTR